MLEISTSLNYRQQDGCKNPLHVMRFHQECVSMFCCYYSGVLYNVRYTIPVCSFNELLQAVVKVLAQVLDVNCFDVISKLLPEPTKVKSNLLMMYSPFFLSNSSIENFTL